MLSLYSVILGVHAMQAFLLRMNWLDFLPIHLN